MRMVNVSYLCIVIIGPNSIPCLLAGNFAIQNAIQMSHADKFLLHADPVLHADKASNISLKS